MNDVKVWSYCLGRFGYRGVMVAGLLTLTVSYLLVGPAPWLTSVFPHKLWFAWTSQLLALSGIGMGAGLALVPAMPFSASSPLQWVFSTAHVDFNDTFV